MNTHTSIETGTVVRTVCENTMTHLLGLVVDVFEDSEQIIAAILWNDGALSFMDSVFFGRMVEILEVTV